MVDIQPETDPFGKRIPLLKIFENAFPAKGIKFCHTVIFDLGFPGKSQLLFDFQFNR